MRWRGQARQAIFRVTAADARPARFDALLIIGGHRRPTTRRLHGEQTPFELVLPDTDLTAVVQPQDGEPQVVVEYALMAGAKRVLYGRGWSPIPVLQRRGHWILVAGIGEAPEASDGTSALSPTPS